MARISPLHVLISIALAMVIVALPMGLILMPIPWMIWVVVASRRESGRGRGGSTVATYVAVTALVIVGAILAPVKTTERVLDRRLLLPKTELTLAEMDREVNFDQTEWLPRYVDVGTTKANADTRIRFSATNITLREFVDTIESQSTLRHRFAHCGNGSSVLFGGDCCFGLRLQ